MKEQEHIELRIKKIKEDVVLPPPRRMSDGASGLDLCVHIENDIILHPLERALLPTDRKSVV